MNQLTHAVAFLYILSGIGYIVYLVRQDAVWNQAGYYLLIAGCLLHTTVIGYGTILAGYLPVRNLRETLSMVAWAMAVLFILFQFRYHLKILGVFASPLSAVVMIISTQLPAEVLQAPASFNSIWLYFHIVTVFLGDAAFALAFGAGIFYLVQEQAIKTKTHGFFYRRLPSLEFIDTTGYACIVVGFSLLTIGLITGFAYAKTVWGHFWSGDPKEIWSGIAWLLYAALLHGRISLGWRGRKAAIMAIIGFAVLMFTFFGVNFFLKGHHGEFTRW
jgi:cytochrome c-type biogenesis protein CcsB